MSPLTLTAPPVRLRVLLSAAVAPAPGVVDCWLGSGEVEAVVGVGAGGDRGAVSNVEGCATGAVAGAEDQCAAGGAEGDVPAGAETGADIDRVDVDDVGAGAELQDLLDPGNDVPV